MTTTEPTDAADAAESTTGGTAATAAWAESPVDRDAVRERLDRVHDPELDRSIVELRYVETLAVEGRDVTVEFVLPTAWCSPAFAWMMATGIRDEVGALDAVRSVTVRLFDHMHGEEITTGVNREAAFEDVFADADDGIDEVRRKLDEKARFARQYDAMRALRDAGLGPAQVAALTRGDVDLDYGPDRAAVTLRDGAVTVTTDRGPLAAYVEQARTTGLVTGDDDRLFADRDGDPIDANSEAVEAVHQDARLAAANVEGQGAICESLHESRNGTAFDGDTP